MGTKHKHPSTEISGLFVVTVVRVTIDYTDSFGGLSCNTNAADIVTVRFSDLPILEGITVTGAYCNITLLVHLLRSTKLSMRGCVNSPPHSVLKVEVVSLTGSRG